MKARLFFRARPRTTLTFGLPEGEALLGREPGMAVSLAMEGVSRRHARIAWDGKLYWLEDLGSTNGTFLNGLPARRERLRHLDVITLGKRVDLVFVLREDEFHAVKREGIVRVELVSLDDEGERYDVPVGEVTLGRASVCNIVLPTGIISSLHARIQRTADQLVVDDMDSSNGTFVNGARVMTSELHNGDVLSLAGVARFHVELELGNIVGSSSGIRSGSQALASGVRARQQFSPEWRTRFDWSSGEMAAFDAVRAGRVPEAEGTEPTRVVAPVAAQQPNTSPIDPPVRKSREATKTAPQPRVESPGGPVTPPADENPTDKAPVVTTRPEPEDSTVASIAVAAPTEVTPVAPKPEATPTQPLRLPEAAQSTGLGPIQEIRLTGLGFELSVREPGAYELGRARESSLRVDHPTVSRRHARVVLAEDRALAYVQDYGGSNGTYLDGQLIDSLAPLADGAHIRVGEIELVVALVRR